jgi:hypothetical protein
MRARRAYATISAFAFLVSGAASIVVLFLIIVNGWICGCDVRWLPQSAIAAQP